ncbi:MAG: UvrD-helicase domain-containing protein [Halanaerobiales bacterium]|nr:UvrD-helicase domain-containing protein [Halanaerobiales bacterium]
MNFRELPPGFWGRKIRGDNSHYNIYKFRLNNGDRILFTYCSELDICKDRYRNSILYIAYSNHDEQIEKSKNISKLKPKEIQIDTNQYYDQNPVDINLDKQYADYNIDLDESITMVLDNKNIKKLLNSNDSKALYFLNTEQFSCLKCKNSLFLSGSAGSGKTTVGIHKLLSLPKNYKVAYFTYTKNLKNNSYEIYNDYSGNNKNDIDFFTLNEYLIDKAEIPYRAFIQYNNFKAWYQKNRYKFQYIRNINILDLWAEIRGILKGFMGVNWIRNRNLRNISLKPNTLSTLKNLDLVEVLNDKCIHLTKNQIKTKRRDAKNKILDCNIPNSDKEKIIKLIDNKIFSTKLIDKATYLYLSNKYTIFNKEDRKNIYKFAQEYQNWLKTKHKYDENDLALYGLKQLNNKNLPIYDYIVIDEVQDLTELQIYFLSKCVKKLSNIFLSGDVNQIINPTYFSFKRLKNFYYTENCNELWSRKHLTKNYRSQKYIVNIANTLTKIRKKTIGSLSLKNDIHETAIRKGEKPFLLERSEKNLEKLINVINERAYAALIVPSIKEKIKLQSYVNNDSGRIFTIKEVKGLEFSYNVCYNLISKYKKEWDEIFAGLAHKNAKYRYYFNALYVGITRGRNNLLLYEEDINQKLFKKIKNYFEYVDQFDKNNLSLTKFSSPQEWYNEGKKLEEKERYARAIKAYKKAISVKGTKISIARCKAKIMAKNGDFEEAGLFMLEQNIDNVNIKDKELIIDFFTKAGKLNQTIKAKLILGLENFENIDRILSQNDMTILDLFENKSSVENNFELLNRNYFDPKVDLFKNKIEDIIDYINLI